MNVLVIDDSRAMRAILGNILRRVGATVVEAPHGVDGLRQLDGPTPPDLVLVDWNMPEMDGLEFVRAVRAQPRLDALPLVMVTTETELSRMAEALASGADEYVMKPFTADALLQKLGALGLTPAC